MDGDGRRLGRLARRKVLLHSGLHQKLGPNAVLRRSGTAAHRLSQPPSGTRRAVLFYAKGVRTLRLPSFAKINPYLRVLGKRPDGLHELFTVFQTVSLGDEMIINENDVLELACTDPRLPTDERNLIIRAAKLLNEKAGTRYGARIELDKKIPSPGGLGGGSSNAAVTLLALTRFWDLRVSIEELNSFASELGSDVPFFLYGGTAIGLGHGGIIEECVQLTEPYMLLVTPDVSIPTAHAYSLLKAENLTDDDRERILFVCRSVSESLDLKHSALRNDIQEAVFAEFPEVRRASDRLKQLGAANVLMSGSGASVFAVFDKEETRQTAIEALDDEVNWRKFAVAAITRDEYREKVYGGL